MNKKFFVRLSQEQREVLQGISKRLNGSSQKVRRANILLMADTNGPNWKDEQIAEAYGCCHQTVENVRKRLTKIGFEKTLDGLLRKDPPIRKKLDGRQEAEIIALRLKMAPKGYSSWSLRLLARKIVELEIVESISYETVRTTLKKMALLEEKCSIG